MSTIFEQPNDGPLKAVDGGSSKTPSLDWRKIDWRTVAPFAAAAALLAWLAWPLLSWWAYEFTKPESYYAHAPIIPFFVALMLWHHREAIAAAPKKPNYFAFVVLLPSLFLLVFAIKRDMFAIMSSAFLLCVWSSVWLVCGNAFVKVVAIPMAFLAFMAPLPGPVLNDATLRIQMMSTVFANKILHLLTFNTHLDGSVIEMENFSLFVDVPCSGFKTLLALLTFSGAFAYLVDGSPIKRAGIFLLSLPLSLVINSVRIALIGVVGECISADAAHTFHDWSGMITLVLGFIVLFSLAKVLGCRKFAGWPIF
jgi:exosortase